MRNILPPITYCLLIGLGTSCVQVESQRLEADAYDRLASSSSPRGPFRKLDSENEPLEALRWGLTHKYVSRDWQYIRRFQMYRPHETRGDRL